MVAIADVKVESNVPARMRDGVTLRADVYRPAASGSYPVLLTRTPYGKTRMPMQADNARAMAARGYIVVVQDTRGRFASEGEYRLNRDDIADGYDSVLWAAGLSGANGNVGMFGGSYMGATQYLAAGDLPAPLKVIMPVWAGGTPYEGRAFEGGAFQLGDRLGWTLGQALEAAGRRGVNAPELIQLGKLSERRMQAMMAGDRDVLISVRREIEQLTDPWMRHLPLGTLPVLQDLAPYYFDQLAHPTYDEFWHEQNVEPRFPRFDLPCFNVAAWYDLRLKGNLDAYTALRAHSRTPESRRAQKLLVGPWTHGIFTPQVGGLNFGPEATLDLQALQARWFDQFLKGENTGILDEPPVRIFVMGANRWRDEDGWPLARTRYTPYYLHSQGKANTLNGDGTLSAEPPAEEPQDAYTYDPSDPVPTVGGHTLGMPLPPGPFDQRGVEGRPDVLCYTTPPLPRDMEVTGPIRLTLYAASDAVDTDWTAKLVDVHADGFAQNIQEGIIRASHRIPGAAPSPIQPGRVYEYTIDLWATSNVFLAGHRIRVEISSSNFPHWDRNTNTGMPPLTADHTIVARQTIFHDAARPSHIMLPIIPA